mgnify:CR=1 FL=1
MLLCSWKKKTGEPMPEIGGLPHSSHGGRNRCVFNDKSHIIYVNSQIKDETALGKLMHDFFVLMQKMCSIQLQNGGNAAGPRPAKAEERHHPQHSSRRPGKGQGNRRGSRCARRAALPPYCLPLGAGRCTAVHTAARCTKAALMRPESSSAAAYPDRSQFS